MTPYEKLQEKLKEIDHDLGESLRGQNLSHQASTGITIYTMRRQLNALLQYVRDKENG